MKTQVIQMAAIARYELLMHWRGRAILVMTLAMLVMTIIPVILVQHQLPGEINSADVSAKGMVFIIFTTVASVLLFIMPVVLANSIPKDRQLNVHEILASTPLSPAVYLNGKLLGSWLTVISGVVVVAAAAALAWGLLVGGFNVALYLQTWLVAGLPIIIINIGMVVLLASPLSDLRLAVLVGVLFCYFFPVVIGFEPRGDWLDLFNPMRPALFFPYSGVMTDYRPTVVNGWQTTLMGLVQLAGLWGLAYFWRKQQ